MDRHAAQGICAITAAIPLARDAAQIAAVPEKLVPHNTMGRFKPYANPIADK